MDSGWGRKGWSWIRRGSSQGFGVKGIGDGVKGVWVKGSNWDRGGRWGWGVGQGLGLGSWGWGGWDKGGLGVGSGGVGVGGIVVREVEIRGVGVGEDLGSKE